MKLITFMGDDGPRLGAQSEGGVVDLFEERPLPAFASMLDLIEAGPTAWHEARNVVATATPRNLKVTLLAPLPLPAQIRDSMCSHQHIRQCAWGSAKLSGATSKTREEFLATFQLPDIYSQQPVYYKCNRFGVGAPDADVVWPDYSSVMDFELELAAIIGRKGRDIRAADALEHVFGFTIFNDFSARDAQGLEMAGRLGPAKGKDFDGGNVFGPCIVTTDEIDDPGNLAMRARVNGETWCDSSSASMNWAFGDLIEHISRGETLHPGEIVCSGTVGDGCGLEHARFLQDGDIVELEVEKIGILRNRIVRARS